MPETLFRVRWPDGQTETCYSPSTVIRDFFEPGRTYPLPDFLQASRAGLRAASDRVRMRHGFGCSRAMAQLSAIEHRVEGFTQTPDDTAVVTVEAFI